MRSIFAIVAAIAVLSIAGFVFFSRQKTDKLPVKTESLVAKESSLPKSQSKYIEYSDGILEKTIESNRVLFFYANWCPTCRPVDKEIMENESRIPNDFVVIRVNYNDTDTDKGEEALANEYGITYQHTFIEIDKNGEIIQSWNGGDLEMLLSKISR